MDGEILDNIKRKYLTLNIEQCSTYRLKGVATLEQKKSFTLIQSKGTNHVVPIPYHSVLKWHDMNKKLSDRKVLFVEGEAGIGKTVLCTLIAKDWASGEHFQEFSIILLLPLYQRNVASACSLPKMLSEVYSLDDEKCHVVASYLKRPCVNNVLVIADGLDKLDQRGLCEGSFFHSLLFGDLLPRQSVTFMITSRPYCVPLNTLKYFNIVYCLRGFSIETVQLCIQSEFNNPVDKALANYLIEQLDENPLFQTICSVPLNLAMILNICRSMPCDQPLPDTLTGLYTKICWAYAETSIKSMEQYKGIMNLSSYQDLPQDLQQPWCLLCELAFRNIENEKYNTTGFVSNELLSFGFLKPVSEEDVAFNFIYRAFEEYLAALHLVNKESQDVQLRFIRAHSKDQTLGSYFWRFFFNIYVNEVLKTKPDNNVVIIEAIQMLSNLYHSSNNEYLLCHYSFEAKCKVVNDKVINSLSTKNDGTLPMTLYFNNASNAYECTAMIYVIESIDQEYCVEINFQKCGLNYRHVDKLASALSNESHNIEVKGLDLSDNTLDDSSVANFLCRAAATFRSLEKLFLHSCGIGSKAVSALMNALADSSSQHLRQLDLSYNPLSATCLCTIQYHIGALLKLEIFILKGSLMKDVTLGSLDSLMDTISHHCQDLRRLDLSDNYLGKPDSPDVKKMILQLTNNNRNLDLRLNEEYMPIVDENIISAVKDSIRKKGVINHIIAHGIIVGPGRSGKNTLMNRLLGKGPPDPNFISPSTGVLEKVVKVEVKNSCTVAATVSNLKFERLEYDEEALELMMSISKYHSVSSPSPKLRQKYILSKGVLEARNDSKLLHTCVNPMSSLASPNRAYQAPNLKVHQKDDSKSLEGEEMTTKSVFVHSPDAAPVELYKRALKLRRMDGLRDHLESSWSLYLTNTGGQPEFQEYLPFLISGPTVFFVTFPLHHNLHKPYTVQYQYPDGKVTKPYLSTATLLEELLQTLATISALSYTASRRESNSGDDSITESNVRPKVYFIGTHRDCLQDINAIQVIDRQLQTYVKQTSLYRQGSIQFVQSSKQMIFTVNNLSEDDADFQTLRSAVQHTVTKKCIKEFMVKCPTSWLVFSLILREKYRSHNTLTFDDCLIVARECGISSSKEMEQALSFIHFRLGLIRYFNVEELNTFVVVDPQFIFDKISELIISTFTSDLVEENEIEDFKQKGIISEELLKRVSDECSSNLHLPPLKWLLKLLNYLRIAALFQDCDTRKYFFPSALNHAPDPESEPMFSETVPPLLITFESGFCPRGIVGALIKCLMTNEMKSNRSWELLPCKIYRNQVTFHIQACSEITLKIFPTHLKICLDPNTMISDNESKITCREAYIQIDNSMKIVTSQHMKCKYFWTFYCTQSTCKVHPHPAEIEWDGDSPSKLKCKVSYPHYKWSELPKGYEVWNIRRKLGHGLSHLQLNEEIDPKHLGQIADTMAEWEGRIADELKLTEADVSSIKTKHPSKLRLQSREALSLWRLRLGSRATYCKLISTFENADCQSYADYVKRIIHVSESEKENASHFPWPQPQTYPHCEPPKSPKLPLSEVSSSSEEYIHISINPEIGNDLPEVDKDDVLDSCNVSVLPLLSPRVVSVCEKYGGLEKATQAAIKIQQSWRQFKQRIRFQRIKQQNKSQLQLQLRKRSQSIQDPHRHPSITNKHAYHQEASVATPPSVEHNRKRAIGINHFNKKPTKGIQYLVESQVLDNNPRSVANFLIDTNNKLSKQKIGEFVGEINSDFNIAVLGCLLEQMDLSAKPIDTALRELQQLFRMPDEAQKIDKIMEIFALEYFKHNKENGSVKSEDAAYILSFAIMMLHTALHNPSVKHKTTKREWVSMNRGCNDGENFSESFLLDIYDRIQSTEFIRGKDHTEEVAEIEKQIIATTNVHLPKLTTPQRHLVLKLSVNEVLDLERKGPNFHRHRRTVFIFNDLVIVCKQRRHEQYHCKNFFQLLHVLPVKFETEQYHYGIQLHSSIERKVLFQCNCDSLDERATLLEKLKETIKDLEEIEKERIKELGTLLSAKPGQEVHIGGSMRCSSTSKSCGISMTDLKASSSLSKLASSSLTDLREQSYEGDNELRPSSYVHVRNDVDTPVSTPTPSPMEQNHIEATDSQTPSPSLSPSPAPLPPTSVPTPSVITHSRSHDGLHMLTLYPNTLKRSPIAELVRSSPMSSSSHSPSHKKSSHYVNISFFRSKKEKETKSGGSSPGGSPIHNRKRRASDSSHTVHSVVRETSPSNVHTPLAQSLNISGHFGTGNLSDNEGHL